MKDEMWLRVIGSASCCDCKHYELHWADADTSVGACHRFPPREWDEEERHAVFPKVCGSDHCGEFELIASVRSAFEAELVERFDGRLK